MVEACDNEASRWYEEQGQSDDTFFICLEHRNSARAEMRGERIRNAQGQLVELAAYLCRQDCDVCD